MENTRRHILKLGGGIAATAAAGAPAIAAAAPAAAPDDAVDAAFLALVNALKTADLDGFYASMHPDFIMIDEDSPFRMSKREFQDHIGFHVSGMWDSFEWLPVATEARAFGDSGLVMGRATFRGKPRDAGFRIRHLLFAQTWTRGAAGDWKLLLWHQSPVDGHIVGVSPG